MYVLLHVKELLFLSDLGKTWIFLDIFSENIQVSNFMKIRPVGAEVYLANWQTDRQREKTKLLITSCNFANVPNQVSRYYLTN